jgi:17beta-estradiol 17-dehydrogenase / very-long-chain 3-oxoacyl-CoA reductase
MFGDPYDLILAIIGLIWAAFFALDILLYIFRLFRRRCPPNLLKKYGLGSWAVITGSSDGIGRAFAEQLAKRGFNLVLIARNKAKLEKVASEISQLNKSIAVRFVVADFNKSAEPGFFDEIYEQIKELNVSILINNVGVDLIDYFHQADETFMRNLLSINVFPTVLLTRKLINHFRSRQDRSAVINVSSTASVTPMPYIGTYGATKIFEDHFSRSLQIEYPEIDFISVRPGYVSTQLTMRKEVGIDTITSEDCAEGALRELGRYERTSSHIKHEATAFFMGVVPSFIMKFVTRFAIKGEMERRKNEEQKLHEKKH